MIDKCVASAAAAVSRSYTELAVIDITGDGFRLVELAPGVELDYVRERTGARLIAN